jgi:hypothetical protein
LKKEYHYLVIQLLQQKMEKFIQYQEFIGLPSMCLRSESLNGYEPIDFQKIPFGNFTEFSCESGFGSDISNTDIWIEAT